MSEKQANSNIKSPLPSKALKNPLLQSVRMASDKRSASNAELSVKKTKLSNGLNGIGSNEDGLSNRARSTTPTLMYKVLEGSYMKERLAHYGLDFDEDVEKHRANIHDPTSRFFGRRVKPAVELEDLLPYDIESHLDQAKYLYHILTNLYVAIKSMDVQGLISITSKDLLALKNEVYDLALNSDMFRLIQDVADDPHDVANFDEDDENDSMELLEENEFLDAADPDFGVSGKITARSAAVINVNHWTNELKNCMHFEFPLTLRKALAVVYYNLCLVRGQKVYRQLHLEMFEKLVSTGDEGTDFTQELIKIGMVLDYKPMKDLLNEFLPTTEPDYKMYDIENKSDLSLFRLLVMLSSMARPFFDPNDPNILTDTMDYFLASISPQTMSVALPSLSCLVPFHYHKDRKVLDYFPVLFSLWSNTSADNSFDTHLYAFVGHVAMDAYYQYIQQANPRILALSNIDFGDYGILTEFQMDFILNRIKNHIKEDYQLCSVTRVVRPLVYSINGKNPHAFFDKLTKLLTSVETYVHPSNTGYWTDIIAKFIHGFIRMYHERYMHEKKADAPYRNELKFTDECHEILVNSFIDLLLVGSQSKQSEVANYYISSFGYLLDMKPKNAHKICDKIIVDLYDALSDQYVNSEHRLLTSLKQFTRIVRFLIEDKLYRVHITNLLSILIEKIDLNNISLTSNLMNSIVSISCFIPIEVFVKDDEYLTFESNTIPFIEQHLYFIKEGGSSTDFQYDESVLEQAFKASTTVFENCMKVYVDKLYQLVDVDLDPGLISKINQTSMIMLQSMDNKMFYYVFGLLEKSFWDNDSFKVKNPLIELVSIPLSASIKRDHSLSVKIFRDLNFNIREQIKNGAGSVRSTTEIQPRDVKLATLLSTLNDVLRYAQESLLTFADDLVDLLEYIYTNVTNPPLDVITAMLLHHTLESLTTTEVVDYRLFQEDCEIEDSEKWGGLQFDKRKYDPKLQQFKWHQPSSQEIDFAMKLIERFYTFAAKSMESLMSDPQNNFNYVDNMKKNILIITNVISGSSILYDADFNQSNKSISLMDPYKKKLLLLQKIRDETCDNNELLVDIEKVRGETGDTDIEMTEAPGSDADENFDISDESTGTENNKLVDYDTEPSEVPSGIATPVPGNDRDSNSSMMNSYMAFRDIDVFSYNYFFGKTASERALDPRYSKIHHLREEIGLFLHKVFKFMNENFENSTSVFQTLLHGLKVWFTDVGQETIFIDDPKGAISIEFLENIQDIAHWEEPFLPFTRTYLAADCQELHTSRLTLHSTNRKPSKLESKLLNDVISLSLSVYPNIHRPAQQCMIHVMKQLIGSYSIIVRKVFNAFEAALESTDDEAPKRLEVLIQVLSMKKIQRKMMSDYNNLERMIILLLRASKINSDTVVSLSDQVLDSVSDLIKIPSKVCLFDESAIDCLKPNDDTIGKQVSVVKTAKDRKRQEYLQKLETLNANLIAFQKKDPQLRWISVCQIVRIGQVIQQNLEIKPNPDVLVQSFELTKTKHPLVIAHCIVTMLNVCNKMISLGNYNYDVAATYRSDYVREYVKYLDSSQPNFEQEFFKEMDNVEHPNYFVDSKAYVGWLSWGRPVGVVKTQNQINFNLRDEDMQIMKEFGKLITKEWLMELCQIFIRSNEAQSSFSTNRLGLFGSLVHLISNECCSMKYEDILDICEEIYDKDDKSSLIACSEIVSGLLLSCKYTTDADLVKFESFLKRFLGKWLDNNYNATTTDIWSVVAWWVPGFIDLRRSPEIYRRFLTVEGLFDVTSESSLELSGKLTVITQALSDVTFKMGSVQRIIDNLVFDHPSDVVRREVGKLFSVIFYVKASAHKPNVKSLLESAQNQPLEVREVPQWLKEKAIKIFEEIETERELVKNLSAQDILKTRYIYLATTMFYWTSHLIHTGAKACLAPFAYKYLAPFLMKLDRMRDVCKMVNIKAYNVYLELAYIPIPKHLLPEMISILDLTDLTSSHELRVNLTYAEKIFSTQSLVMKEPERQKILDFVVDKLYYESSVEVRQKAAFVLAGIVHNISYDTATLHMLLDHFNKKLGSYTSKQKAALSKSNTEIHGAVLGLGAIIEAFPYVSPLPDWVPANIAILASWARTSGMCGAAAKNIISRYKKVRADTWHLDRFQFTSEQLEDMEGVLWRSYYA